MRERLEKLLEQQPDKAELALALAQLCLRENDSQSALRYAKQAVGVDSGYSAALLTAGLAAREQGDVSAAREWFVQAQLAAEARGDMQILRQVQVYLKRMDSKE